MVSWCFGTLTHHKLRFKTSSMFRLALIPSATREGWHDSSPLWSGFKKKTEKINTNTHFWNQIYKSVIIIIRKKKVWQQKGKPLGNEMIVREQNISYGLFGTYHRTCHCCYEHLGYFVHHVTISYNFGPSLK